MKILTLGFFDHLNVGDEQYKTTFPCLFPQHEFKFVNTLHKHDVDNCDAIILGGGNVIRKGFLNQLSKYHHKKIFAFSASTEGVPDQDISFFKHVYARDYHTIKVMQDKKIPCTFIPDVAMILEGNAEAGKRWMRNKFDEEKLDLYEKTITVVINGYMLNGGLGGLARDAFTFIKFSYDLARTIDETPASFIFLPFGTKLPHDDRVANSWVASKCKYWNKNYVEFDRMDYQTILNIIAASAMIISSRLHSSIFSFTTGTPFIDITHHSKNELFLEMIERKNNSISFWNMDNTLLKNKICKRIDLPKETEAEKHRKAIWETVSAIRFDK
ncbi:MAG: polysaccharide pyruvyl transferase family protein [Crenarchaeota archaeon]|nr:MAG: polysaccharide pyruvyl transferase family protein [Thermoproteota archaeon]